MSDDSCISCSLRSDSDSLGKNEGSLTRPLNDCSEGLPIFFPNPSLARPSLMKDFISSPGGLAELLEPESFVSLSHVHTKKAKSDGD